HLFFLRQPSPCHLHTFFFFPCSPHSRDLPSFPTRRSSDLRLYRRLAAPAYAAPRLTAPPSPSPTPSAPLELQSPSFPCPPPNRRSEEHTSELQSRFDLVCRLLLEKKNT